MRSFAASNCSTMPTSVIPKRSTAFAATANSCLPSSVFERLVHRLPGESASLQAPTSPIGISRMPNASSLANGLSGAGSSGCERGLRIDCAGVSSVVAGLEPAMSAPS